MSFHLNRTAISDQVFFSSIIDKRYKTNRISVNLILPLAKETASVNALIPSLLRKGTRECPDFTELNKRLAILYGAYLGYNVTAVGDCQVMTLSAGAIDDFYALDGEPLLQQVSRLLADALLDPENVICVSDRTHKAIHYGDDTILKPVYTERRPGDTCPWRK